LKIPLTELEYRVWQQADESHRDEILELKGRLSMADYLSG